VLDAISPDEERMLGVAREAGYSETAFLRPHLDAAREYDVRYFSSEAEVPFCGHATVAAGAALTERDVRANSSSHQRGPASLSTRRDASGVATASLTSVQPYVEKAEDDAVDEAVRALRWRRDELDPELSPRISFAGACHLILAAATRRRLAGLDYEFERLKALMLELTTVDLVWRDRDDLYHVRNPFPVGGVHEDPATGAAAAAFGGYLRALGLVATPARVGSAGPGYGPSECDRR
jgi:PhzF family phenazine biosynthesis protein